MADLPPTPPSVVIVAGVLLPKSPPSVPLEEYPPAPPPPPPDAKLVCPVPPLPFPPSPPLLEPDGKFESIRDELELTNPLPPLPPVALLNVLAELPLRPVSYTHLRAHETRGNLVCRLLLEKKKGHS